MEYEKELFLNNINRLKALYNKFDEMRVGAKGDVDFRELDEVIELVVGMIEMLEQMMEDISGDIMFFMFGLDFGESYEPGRVVDEEGNEIDFSTAEKLYEYLAHRRSLMAVSDNKKLN